MDGWIKKIYIMGYCSAVKYKLLNLQVNRNNHSEPEDLDPGRETPHLLSIVNISFNFLEVYVLFGISTKVMKLVTDWEMEVFKEGR